MDVSTNQNPRKPRRPGRAAVAPRARSVASFPPVWRRDARVLVLGSMPGTASLRAGRYYAHPRNHFWGILGACLGFSADAPYAARLAALRRAGVALWDVARRCRRRGSLDADIEGRSVEANDVAGLLAHCPRLHTVLFNGHAPEVLFRRHVLPRLGVRAAGLRLATMPSTSPAHAALRAEAKLRVWRAALADAGVGLAYGLSRRTR